MVAKRAVLIGLDALQAKLFEKFSAEGRLPNLQRLMQKGFTTEAIPTLPAITPPGWTTILTGAWPGTHGVEDFTIHHKGDPLDQRLSKADAISSYSRICKAELLWEAAERVGKKSIILKFPCSWPPRMKNSVQFDGCGGWGGIRCIHEIASPMCFTTDKPLNAISVKLLPIKGWKNVPPNYSQTLETVLNVEPKRGGRVKQYQVLILDSGMGYDSIVITKSKNFDDVVTKLSVGEWSDWITDTFVTEKGSFKFKLIELSSDAERFKLYLTQIHRITGFTVPDDLAEKIHKDVGPFWEYTSMRELYWNWIDQKTQLEIYEGHTKWMEKATKYLMKNYDWTLFFTQLHPIDYAQHIFWGATDPEHPDYNPKVAEKFKDALPTVYGLADKYVGSVIEEVDDDTLIIVTGDHGATSYHTTFYVNNLLAKEGLLSFKAFPETGGVGIDWTKTKAFGGGAVNIYINLKGRDPKGLVNPGEEYEKLRDKIIDILSALEDPVTKKRPISMILKREEARGLGYYGDGAGDIVYTLKDGYYYSAVLGRKIPQVTKPKKSEGWYYTAVSGVGEIKLEEYGYAEKLPIFERTRLFNWHTCEHGSSSPFSKDLRTITIFAGPNVKKGVKRAVPIRLVDIAPTIAYLTGIPTPANSEGSIILDALESF